MAEKKTVKIDDEKFDAEIREDTNSSDRRDVIYVDTEDDITSIIEKIKNAKYSAIALVPPARAGVLQSVVNLKLLQRAAKLSRKKISLITSDKALVSLASGLQIPIAKNLSAKAGIPVLRNDLPLGEENEIDGKDFAVGELAALDSEQGNFAKKSDSAKEKAAVAAIEADDEIRGEETDFSPNEDKPKKGKPQQAKKRIPDFNIFRKKLLISGGIAVAVIAFLVWAIVIAPHGLITIVAKTTPQQVSASVSLTPNDQTNVGGLKIQPIVKSTSKTESVSFTATGSQMVGGAKATGTVTLTNHSQSKFDPNTGASNAINLPAGTNISVSGQHFTTDSSVSINGGGGTNTVSVTAVNPGTAYNAPANSAVKITGYDQATQLDGAAKGDFSGGQDQTKQSVVQQSDLDDAIAKLKNQDGGNQNQFKQQLQDQFGSGAVIIKDSFNSSFGNISGNPPVGSVVGSGTTPTASATITYSMIAISENDLNSFLDSQINNSLGDAKGQKIYDNGSKKVKFANLQNSGKNYSVTISTTGQVGPSLDVDAIKTMALGQKSGQIRSDIQSKFNDNIKSIKVDFSPFWVDSISDKSKLTVNFEVNE